MKPGIILALILSIVLVGGASWYRYSGGKTEAVTLLSVENESDNTKTYEELFSEFLSERATSTPASQEPLTGTELVGRQLMIDYLALSGSGQATPTNIQALADKYVESIPTLHSSVRVGYQDLKTAPDSKNALAFYSNELSRIYNAHRYDFTSMSVGEVKDDLENSHYSLMLKAASSYEAQAIELKNITVPISLVSAHLKLINTNLSIASALKAAANTEDDPASGFAGLIKIGPELETEKATLFEISALIKRNVQ